MKKRILSFVTVIFLAFSGVFSCLASAADQSPADFLFDLWENYTVGGQFYDYFGFGSAEKPKESMIDNITEMEQTDNGSGPPGKSCFEYGVLHNAFNTVWDSNDPCTLRDCMAIKPGGIKCTLLPGKSWRLGFVSHFADEGVPFNITWAIFDSSGRPMYAHYYWRYQSVLSDHISGYHCDQITYCYVRFAFNTSVGQLSPPQTITADDFDVYVSGDGFKWGWDDDCSWSSDFDINAINDLDISLTSSEPLDPNVHGEFYVVSGIYYNDGTDCVYAGEYVKSDNISFGSEWHWLFDLGAFSEYVYRKRCGFDHFYAFVAVYSKSQNRYVYFDNMALNVKPPGGIFDDVRDPPSWDDYKPDPVPFPTAPTFIFNYTSTNNTVTNLNQQTITNYVPDQDPDIEEFIEWFSGAVETINENITNAYDVLNDQITNLNENVDNYFNAVKDFVEGGLYDILTYIAELIEKFNTDFNNWADAASHFFDDNMTTLNTNIAVVGDNIVKAIETQLVPDEDVVFNIMMTKCTFFKQSHDVFSQKEVQERDFSANIPLGYDDLSFSVDFGELLSAPYYGQLRSAANVFILASTFFGAINIILKIFGLGFGSDSDE